MSFMSKKSAKHEAASLNGPLGMHAGILIYAVCGVVVLLAARTILLGAWLDTVLLAVGLSATLIFRYLYLSKGNARAVPFLQLAARHAGHRSSGDLGGHDRSA